MASQQQDMLLALTLQNQVIALIVLQKQRKATILVSRSLETTKTAKSSLQFKLRNELQDYTMCFNYLRILPSTFDEWVRLVRPFVVSKGSISFLFFPTSVIKARQFFTDSISCSLLTNLAVIISALLRKPCLLSGSSASRQRWIFSSLTHHDASMKKRHAYA